MFLQKSSFSIENLTDFHTFFTVIFRSIDTPVEPSFYLFFLVELKLESLVFFIKETVGLLCHYRGTQTNGFL